MITFLIIFNNMMLNLCILRKCNDIIFIIININLFYLNAFIYLLISVYTNTKKNYFATWEQ